MMERASPGVQLFVGAGFWIIARHLTPAPDWHLNVKIFVGFLTIVGALLAISAVSQSARRVGPWWQGLAGRLIAVGTAWLMIGGVASYYGTPHVLYEYPPRQSVGTCVYFGWKGLQRAPIARGDWNGCSSIVLLR